jgi:hypothetical protein
MTVINVLAHLELTEFDDGVAWYSKLFGREPDRRPMDGCAEWQLAGTGGVQVYDGENAPGTLIIGVSRIDETAADLATRDITLDITTVESGQFRVAALKDPSGNTVMFTESNE